MKRTKQEHPIPMCMYLIIELCGADAEEYRHSAEFRSVDIVREVLKKRGIVWYMLIQLIISQSYSIHWNLHGINTSAPQHSRGASS